MLFTTRRRVLGIFGPFAIASAFGLTALASCAKWQELLFFLPSEAREGKHYTQPLTQVDIDRGKAVAACLQGWARMNGYPSADYSDVDFTRLTLVAVGDPGVVNNPANPTDFVGGRESGDSVFYPAGESRSSGSFIGTERHEDVHIVQQQHPELIGANGDIHWAPPWNACQVPRAIVSS